MILDAPIESAWGNIAGEPWTQNRFALQVELAYRCLANPLLFYRSKYSLPNCTLSGASLVICEEGVKKYHALHNAATKLNFYPFITDIPQPHSLGKLGFEQRVASGH